MRVLRAQAASLVASPFARSVSSMMAYTALGHSIYLLVAPAIGRLYTPEQIGLYGLFFTIAVTAAGFMCLLYDLAIPAARTDDEARELTIGAATIALLLCPLMGLGMTLCVGFDLFGMGQLPVWAGLLMVAMLALQIAIQLSQGWRIREQETIIIGKSNVTLNVGRGATQIGLGVFLPTWWALALGELLGRVGTLWHLLLHHPLSRSRPGPKPAQVRATLRRYREFATVLMPAQFVDGVAIVAQVSGLTMLFGPAALGQYFLMRRTLDLPTAFVFRSLSDVFYAKLADYTRTAPERVRPFFTKAFLLLAIAGLFAGSPLILFGPELFRLVYGPGWEEAGMLAAVMMPAAVLNLAVAPVSRVFALTARPHLRFATGIVSVVGTFLVMFAAWQFSWTLFQATAGLSVAISLSYIAYFVAGYVASAHMRPNADDATLGDDCRIER